MFLGGIKRVPYVDMSNSYLCHSWLKTDPAAVLCYGKPIAPTSGTIWFVQTFASAFCTNLHGKGQEMQLFSLLLKQINKNLTTKNGLNI